MATVVLVGGASGTGKTQLSTRLARHLGMGMTPIDDLHLAVRTMTTPAQQPELHAWFVHPDPGALTAEQIVDLHLGASRALLPALEAVVLDHLQEGLPCVMEGSYLLPDLLTRPVLVPAVASGEVRAVFLYEAKEQVERNLQAREPESGAQSGRARVSGLLNDHFRREAGRCGLPSLAARPWDTLLERALAALDLG